MKSAVVMVACAVVLLWKCWSLNLDYKHELDAHLQTQKQLAVAITTAQRWQVVAGETLLAAEAQKQLAEACLSRESQAQTDAEARKLLLATAKPRPRTETESKQVVDDETRTRAVSRLNRGL